MGGVLHFQGLRRLETLSHGKTCKQNLRATSIPFMRYREGDRCANGSASSVNCKSNEESETHDTQEELAILLGTAKTDSSFRTLSIQLATLGPEPPHYQTLSGAKPLNLTILIHPTKSPLSTPRTTIMTTPFAPPTRRGDFLYSSLLYADAGNANHHPRATVAELAALLRPEAPNLYSKDRQPAPSTPAKDPPWHFYSAQLIHYGLPVTKDKNAAKVRLLNALNQFKLEVPAWVLGVEGELRREWEGENRRLKVKEGKGKGGGGGVGAKSGGVKSAGAKGSQGVGKAEGARGKGVGSSSQGEKSGVNVTGK